MKHENDVELCSMEDMVEFGVSKQIRGELGRGETIGYQNNYGYL